jgi:hypothetical protein
MARRPEYNVWDAMIQRCTNPKHKKFKDYGARGITVCERRRGPNSAAGRRRLPGGFDNFLADMGPRPEGQKGKLALYSIERIDNERGYEPGNVRWATQQEQAFNKRLRSDGKLTIEQVRAIRTDTRRTQIVADEYGVERHAVSRIRLGKGWRHV